MMDVAVHDGSQTDPAVAWRSETDQIRLPAQFPLRRMMICHLARDQSAFYAIARKYDQLQIWRKVKFIQRDAKLRHLKRLKGKSLPTEGQKTCVIWQITPPE
jgi:hypothetical protein